MMRLGHIIIAALVMASICIVSAANDNEILIFAKGVLASDNEKYNVNILGDNLSIEGSLDQYSNSDVDTIGYRLSRMSGLAKKIIDAYPGRFKRLDTKLYDSSEKSLVGTMSIVVGSAV